MAAHIKLHSQRMSKGEYVKMFDEKWQAFSERAERPGAPPLKYQDVPFWGDKDMMNLLGSHLSDKAFTKTYRKSLTRWHPDKFRQVSSTILKQRAERRRIPPCVNIFFVLTALTDVHLSPQRFDRLLHPLHRETILARVNSISQAIVMLKERRTEQKRKQQERAGRG